MDKKETKPWTKERKKEYDRKYYELNKEKRKEYCKKWHEENKEHVKKYLEDNKEKIAEKSKEWRETHVEERKKLWEEWYKNNRNKSPKRRFSSAVAKAKKRGINWTLTFEQYISLIEKPCYYCENKLGDPVTTSCGLDRLNSDGYYEINNVVSCCFTCNVMKNINLTPEETKVAVKAIIEYRNQQLAFKTDNNNSCILPSNIDSELLTS